MTLPAIIAVGSIVAIRVGNPGDCGEYHGQVVTGRVIGQRKLFGNETGHLVQLEDNPAYLCDAGPSPYSDDELYTTNARHLDGGRWTPATAVQSLGYGLAAVAQVAVPEAA